jgi:glycosyltransferase involved in cell wall biosynthesis
VLVPSFNRAHTISQTLESLLAQTYDEWECLVVDDGSTDDSLEVVRRFAESDSRIRLLSRSRGPKGACTCRNIGVEKSRGEYVLFLDSDDLIAPWCLEQRVGAFANAGDVDFVVFPALMFRETPGDEDFLWNVITADSDLIRFLQLDSPWQGTGPMWRRESFIRVGGWSEDLKCWQDVELAIRGFEQRVSYTTRYDLRPDLYLRRGDGNTISSGALRSREKLASKRQVLERALSLAKAEKDRRIEPAIKTLATAVILDHALGRDSRRAIALAWELGRLGVYSTKDLILVLGGIASHARGINRIPGSPSLRGMVARRFGSSSTIGRVTYSPALKSADRK